MDNTSKEQILNKFNHERFAEAASEFEGVSAIYIEEKTFTLVRVHELKHDDWGMSLTLTCIPIEGLGRLGKEQINSCQLGAAWEIFSGGWPRWSARYVGWELLFGEPLVELVNQLAAKSVAQGIPLDIEEAKLRIYELERGLRMAKNAGTLTGLENSSSSSMESDGDG